MKYIISDVIKRYSQPALNSVLSFGRVRLWVIKIDVAVTARPLAYFSKSRNF